MLFRSFISAAGKLGGQGLDEVRARLGEILGEDLVERQVRLQSSDKGAISRVYEESRVLDARYHDGYVDLTFRTDRARALGLARLALEQFSGGEIEESD